ncbi:retrovirus-related pol polyprotein from transposon TNT 1-94 [Tanacetum coccineum]
MKIKESLNVTFNETPPPSKTSPSVDDDLDEEEIKVTEKKNLENDIEDKTLEIDEVVNIKESRNHTLENELVPQPKNMTIIGTKWVFRNKLDENGVVSQNKAMLVAQGYNKQEGIDYDETYAPVARLESIRILLAYAYALYFRLFQMDVKSAFLNGFINEDVYVAQPLGFIDFKRPDHVYKLKKALYGLQETPKAWYDRLKDFLIKHEYKLEMFKMSMMGELNFFLGLQIKQMEDGMSMMGELNFFLGLQIKQMKDEMLKKFGLEDSKPMKTPMSSDTKLTKDEECELVDSIKYRCMIEINRFAISAIEAKYVSAGKACQQALWTKQALIDYDIRLDDVLIMCDNKGTIDLSKNPVQHSRTKDIKIHHHFLLDNVQKGHISIKKVPSVDNITDLLTKPLKRESFNYLCHGLGMMEHIP